MTRPGIEPRSPGSLVNTLSIMPITFGLVGFYCISTIVGYLMPNPVFTKILDIICKHIL